MFFLALIFSISFLLSTTILSQWFDPRFVEKKANEELIKTNREALEVIKSNNIFLSSLLFFLGTIIWVLLLGFGNLGAYNFYPLIPVKDKSTAHANPEELLSLMKDLKVKKVIGMHWGTAILSLEPIWEPPVRFKENAEKFGYKKEEAIIFRIGEIKKLNDLIN